MTTTQLPLLAADPTVRRAPLPVLDQLERGTSFHEVPIKAILNSPATTGMGFWSLNPYIGCEFGCTYCYARETHRWVVERRTGRRGDSTSGIQGLGDSGIGASPLIPESPDPAIPESLPPWLAFEKQILVKTSAAAVLARTLFPAKLAGSSLVIGTATDPYQPAERRFRLTQSILQALHAWRGLTLSIITKSPLVLRDLAILQQLSQRHELTVCISLSSVDRQLIRRLEARSPAPHARLRALKGLVDGGVHAGLMVAPIIPGLSDGREALAAVMAAGKAAGARFVTGAALRLGPVARARFLPHLEQEFPELVERYARRYGGREGPGRDYTEALALRLRRLQREYGFPVDVDMNGRRRRQGHAPQHRGTENSGILGFWDLGIR